MVNAWTSTMNYSELFFLWLMMEMMMVGSGGVALVDWQGSEKFMYEHINLNIYDK